MKTNIFQMDKTDDKIKIVVAKSFSEHELGKSITVWKH